MPKTSLILDEKTALKRKKATKITALCLLAVVFVLVVLIVVAACVTTSLKPNFIKNPDRIIVYNQNSTYGQFSQSTQLNDSRYENFISQFDESFSTNYLVALFSGSLGDYTIDRNSERTSFSEIQAELQTGFYVQFVYTEPQTLTYANGDTYFSIYASQTPIQYTSLYFALSDTDSLQTLDMYVAYKTSESSTNTYVVKISQKANTFALYENRAAFRS